MNEKQENILHIELINEGDFLGFKWSKFEDLPELNDLFDTSKQPVDWSAFYTCLDYPTAEGYLVNRLPEDGKGNGTVYMHKIFSTKPLQIVVCSDKGFQDGSYKHNGTVERIKRELKEVHGLNIELGDSLLPRLGELGFMFRCFHDKDGTEEIVIPHILKSTFLRPTLLKKYIFKSYCVVSSEEKLEKLSFRIPENSYFKFNF